MNDNFLDIDIDIYLITSICYHITLLKSIDTRFKRKAQSKQSYFSSKGNETQKAQFVSYYSKLEYHSWSNLSRTFHHGSQ